MSFAGTLGDARGQCALALDAGHPGRIAFVRDPLGTKKLRKHDNGHDALDNHGDAVGHDRHVPERGG